MSGKSPNETKRIMPRRECFDCGATFNGTGNICGACMNEMEEREREERMERSDEPETDAAGQCFSDADPGL